MRQSHNRHILESFFRYFSNYVVPLGCRHIVEQLQTDDTMKTVRFRTWPLNVVGYVLRRSRHSWADISKNCPIEFCRLIGDSDDTFGFIPTAKCYIVGSRKCSEMIHRLSLNGTLVARDHTLPNNARANAMPNKPSANRMPKLVCGIAQSS